MTRPQGGEIFIKFSDLSRITRTPAPTLAQRIDRGIFKLSRRDKLSSGSGSYREFSRITTIKFAIAQKFVELNVSAGPAHEAASLFTDHSQPGRAAGELFPQDRTVICLRKSGPVLINAPYFYDFADLADHGDAFVALDCAKICREVDTALSRFK